MRYAVHNQELGRGPVDKERFKTLAEVAAYIQDRWQGVEYMDGDTAFHTDYCTYTCHGFALTDLGSRTFPPGESYLDWQWKEEFKPKPHD